jgi:anionic cell wall polymer biosynthesis LytR-Cps2A-Psr (LCP) family protein
MVRKPHIDVSLALLAAIALIVVSGVVFIFLTATSRLDILRGGDEENEVENTLFIIESNKKPLAAYVTLYYPLTRRAAVFNVPGDVGRLVKQINRVDRIDTVYNGRRLSDFVFEVSDLLGLEIHNILVFDISSLEKIVDILEGVRVFIPSGIEIYDGLDSTLFPSGWTALDGDKTKAYLLYEEAGEPESSRQRHQRFFIALLKRFGEKNAFIAQSAVDRALNPLIRSNMSRRERARLFDEWTRIDADRINIQLVGGIYREVSGQTLLIPHYDGSLIKDIIRQTLAALTRQGGRALSDRVITVEVLNGTNTAGLAGRTADLIRGFGYDVITVGNADRNDYDKTEIIDRINQPDEVRVFADMIHCENVISEETSALDYALQSYEYKADFTLIIGRDYNG